MKKIYLLIFAGAVLASCDKQSDENSSTLGGDTAIPMNTVGNQFSGTISIGDNYFYTDGIVTESEDGILSVNVACEFPEDFPLADLLPDSYKDGDGNLDATLEFKNTSEGILDHLNEDGKPFVLVKYDCKVGDKYVCDKKDGTKITRTVTRKSTTDEYPYGFYLIKTITVEQDSRIPGIEKIVYNANHHFGLVGVDFVMEDGSTIHTTVYSENNVTE
jgi:hypothetical protein